MVHPLQGEDPREQPPQEREHAPCAAARAAPGGDTVALVSPRPCPAPAVWDQLSWDQVPTLLSRQKILVEQSMALHLLLSSAAPAALKPARPAGEGALHGAQQGTLTSSHILEVSSVGRKSIFSSICCPLAVRKDFHHGP